MLTVFYPKNEVLAALLRQLDQLKDCLGFTEKGLAAKLGFSRAYLSYLRRGARPPTPRVFERILAAFPGIITISPDGLIVPGPFIASMSRTDDMDAKLNNLRQTIEDYKLAKQAEGCSNDGIAWFFETNGLATDIHGITPGHIRSLLVYVGIATNRWGIGSTSSRKPASRTTVDAYWRTCQSFFSWLVREELIDEKTNPMKKIPRPDFKSKVIKDIPLPLIKKAADECGNFI